MANQLPPYPKLHKNRIQRDSAGNIIYVNHFQELKSIQEKMNSMGYSKSHPKTAAAWAKYASMVLSYDKKQKSLSMLEKSTIYAIIIILVIAASYFQTEIQSFFK